MNWVIQLRCSAWGLVQASLVGLGLASFGCSDVKPEFPEQDRVVIEPFRSTVILSDADLEDIEVNESDGTIEMLASAPSVASLQRGRVIVAGKSEGTPHGLLRVVRSVVTEDDRVRLETLHAPIQLAFRKVHIETMRRSTGELGSSAWSSDRELLTFDPFRRHVGASQSLDAIIFDGDGDPKTTNDQVSVSGELAGAVEFLFKLDFDWGAFDDLPGFVEDCLLSLLELEFECSLTSLMPEAKAVMEVTPSLASRIDLQGAAVLDFQKDVQLFESNVGQLVFGPIVVTPNVRILASVEGEASSRFATSVDAAVYFDSSVTLSSKHPTTPAYQPPRLREVSFDPRPPEVTLRANARAALGVELSLLIYGVTGPYARAQAYGEVNADVFRSPCVELLAGLQGSLGVKLTTPAFLFINPIDLFNWQVEFDAFEEVLDVPVPPCEPPPDASMLPPGAGPDAAHLASPTFEPWSRTLSSLLDSGGANPGGTTYWLDQQRAIDGRVVVTAKASQAIVKLEENGEVVWAKSLEDSLGLTSTLHPVRSVATKDAAMFVLAEADIPPLRIVKLTQSGNVLWSRTLEVPDAIQCGVKPVAVTRDSGSGFYVVTACPFTRLFHITHLDEYGVVLGSTRVEDPSASGLEPTVATQVNGEVFVSGRLRNEGASDSMFGFRQDADGQLVFAERYVACESGPDVFPYRAIASSEGDITVAGRGGAQHNGFVARLKRDGSVGFASFPGFGFGLGSVFVVDGIAELPTTGFIVSGSSVALTGAPPENTPGFALLQLDAVGKPIWSRRYTMMDGDGEYQPASETDISLTDDGGVLVSGFARQSETGIAADLWFMKVFARDGHIDFTPGKAVAGDLGSAEGPIVALDCSLSTASWSPTIEEEPAMVTHPADVMASNWTATVTAQTP